MAIGEYTEGVTYNEAGDVILPESIVRLYDADTGEFEEEVISQGDNAYQFSRGYYGFGIVPQNFFVTAFHPDDGTAGIAQGSHTGGVAPEVCCFHIEGELTDSDIDLIKFPPMVNTNTILGVTATANSELGGAASNAVNGSVGGHPSNAWSTGTISPVYPSWIKFELVSAIAINYLRIYPVANKIDDFVLSGSNDDITYTNILTDALPSPGLQQWHNYGVDNTTAYAYYKLTITSGFGANNNTGAYEIELNKLSAINKIKVRSKNTTATVGRIDIRNAVDGGGDGLVVTVLPGASEGYAVGNIATADYFYIRIVEPGFGLYAVDVDVWITNP